MLPLPRCPLAGHAGFRQNTPCGSVGPHLASCDCFSEDLLDPIPFRFHPNHAQAHTYPSRNVDLGALINAGGTTPSGATSTGTTASGTSSTPSLNATAPATGMFGIARTDAVRIDVSVPQA